MKKLLITTAASLCIGGAFSQNNVIPTNGNVGIGTITPSEKLSVNGNVKIDSTLTVDTLLVKKDLNIAHNLNVQGKSEVDDVDINGAVTVNGDATFNSSSFFNGTSNFSAPAVFNHKVSMTNLTTETDPTALTFIGVASNGGVKKFDLSLSLFTNLVYQSNECPGGDVLSPTWQNGLNKLFSPCPEVFVGIGTNSPSHSLHNMGDTKFEGELAVGGNMAIGNATVPSSFSKLKIRNTNMNVGLELDNSGLTGNYKRLFYLQYTNPTTEIMRVVNSSNNHVPFLLEASGQMTIKSETKTILMLMPDGMLRARRVKVDADTWADYVFEPTYELMPLDELSLFLSKNKHLPNIPSEKDVKENGIDLAQMNMLLLEKVEQLTLYLIEQNKSTNELRSDLESKIEVLQKEIDQLRNK